MKQDEQDEEMEKVLAKQKQLKSKLVNSEEDNQELQKEL